MNLGDLTNLVERPFAAMSNIVNTPNSAGRYRPFYLRNLLDAVQGRKLSDAVEGKTILITGGSSGIGEAAAKKIAEAGGTVDLFSIVPVKRSHSVCAQGGINAALGK